MKRFVPFLLFLCGCHTIVYVPVPATSTPPHDLHPRAASAAAVTLGWVPSAATTIQSQTLSFGVQNGVYTNDTVLAANVTQYQITGLVYAQSYWFAVKALDVNGLYSPYSVPLNYVTTNAPAVPPPPPTNLKVISAP
jgi:hypothetical protein